MFFFSAPRYQVNVGFQNVIRTMSQLGMVYATYKNGEIGHGLLLFYQH